MSMFLRVANSFLFVGWVYFIGLHLAKGRLLRALNALDQALRCAEYVVSE